MEDWTLFKIIVVLLSFFWFSWGTLLIDYGSSLQNGCIFQTLLLDKVEPRVIYHSGLLIVFGSFFAVVLIALNELLKRRSKPV